MDSDITDELLARVREAIQNRAALRIVGGDTKGFYGRAPQGVRLETYGHSGILDYEPSELVITARSGTPLNEIDAALAEHGQMLAFEPPHFGDGATLGGTVACGLSGPRRPWGGALRDHVLGVKIINGKGETLSFGGQVMKNVAGFDVSRLMAGALGTLGVLLEVSLKVLPRPSQEITLVSELDAKRSLRFMSALMGRSSPLSAACHHKGHLYLRVSGSEAALQRARTDIGGDELPDSDRFWSDLREQRLDLFQGINPLWRLSLPPATPPLELPGNEIIDWGGAQRWLVSHEPAERIREAAEQAGGHATAFRCRDRKTVFQPLPDGLAALHRNLKQAFDPQSLFNPGRMYPDW